MSLENLIGTTSNPCNQLVCGVEASQVKGFHLIFEEFKESLQGTVPDVIVEIGTYQGGFTIFLKHLFPETRVVTYDITTEYVKTAALKEHGIEFRNLDVFSDEGTRGIVELVTGASFPLLFCDGKNKPGEVEKFAPYIPINGFIFAHDYMKDYAAKEYLFANGVWGWWEISEDSVKESCRNFVPYMQDRFSQIVWLCRRRTTL